MTTTTPTVATIVRHGTSAQVCLGRPAVSAGSFAEGATSEGRNNPSCSDMGDSFCTSRGMPNHRTGSNAARVAPFG